MTRLLAIMVACVTFILVDAQQVQAQYSSYGTNSGYTYRDGYWWNASGLAFTRKKVAYRYRQGCCWHNGYRYEYRPVQIDPHTDDATKRLLEIAAARDRVEGKIRAQSNNHNMFLEKLEALGMKDNFRWNGYGYQMQMATGAGFGSQAYNYTPYAQQGNTVYGYSNFTTPYGNVDMTLALKQAKDLAQNAQTLAGAGHQQFMEYLQEMADGQSRVAEIMAKTELLRAAEPKDAPRRIQSFTFRASTGNDGRLQVEQVQGQSTNTDGLFAVLQNRCVSCHGGTKTEGNVDMRGYLNFSKDQQRRVIELVTSPDPSQRMPKGSDGSAGEALSLDEVIEIIKHSK